MWGQKPEPPDREQLIEAKARLERQIEIMSAGTIRPWGYQPGSLEALQRQLAEIEEILASLGPEGGGPRPGTRQP